MPNSAALATLLDQQTLVLFLSGKLAEAEAAAERLRAAAERLFADEEAAIAMCSLRHGTVLAGARTCPAQLRNASTTACHMANLSIMLCVQIKRPVVEKLAISPSLQATHGWLLQFCCLLHAQSKIAMLLCASFLRKLQSKLQSLRLARCAAQNVWRD